MKNGNSFSESSEKTGKTIAAIKYWSLLNLGILMMSVGIYFFKSPNGFATGGVSGISIIIANIFENVSQATAMLVINVFLLILGTFILGKECGLMTVFCSLMISAENWIFEYFIQLEQPITSYPLLELVYAVLLTGVGSAIIFKCNASSGGTDIVALIMRKYTSLDVGKALLLSDFLIAASTFFVVGIEAGLFSLLGLFAKVFVVDDILDSINMCKAFSIITNKADEIDSFICNNMHRSATLLKSRGAYSGEEREMIITVCRMSEAIKLRRKVKQIDPSAFIIITKTSEIMGKGFRDNVN